MPMVRKRDPEESGTAEGLQPRLLTAAQAANYMGLAEGTVRRMMAAGTLPVVKIGKAARVDRVKLDELLDGGVLDTGS